MSKESTLEVIGQERCFRVIEAKQESTSKRTEVARVRSAQRAGEDVLSSSLGTSAQGAHLHPSPCDAHAELCRVRGALALCEPLTVHWPEAVMSEYITFYRALFNVFLDASLYPKKVVWKGT